MIATGKTVIFSHSGLSLAESEIIYNILNALFNVQEESSQSSANGDDIVSTIFIKFPIPYGESFFDAFNFERWFKIKNVIKEIKRRRGKRRVKLQLYFSGILLKDAVAKCHLIFQVANREQNQFEMAIEKIEYLTESVPLQLDSLPDDVTELLYIYDDNRRKWAPYGAGTHLNKYYLFINNRWMK